MKFEALVRRGRELNEEPERRAAELRSLCADSRFAAVVGLILEQEEIVAEASCVRSVADHHGQLAHAAGVQYGMREVLGKLRQACEPARKRGMREPEGES